MRSIDRQKKGARLPEGFLLIEVLTALVILNTLVVVIMISLARGIQWNHEAQLRLRALNVATTTLEHLSRGRSIPVSDKKRQKFSVTVVPGKAFINQKKHNKKIPTTGKSTEPFKIVVVTSEWKSSSGEKKSVQLITGIISAKGLVAM